MLLQPRQKIIKGDNNKIKINNTTVPFSISTKFFGDHIDNNLTSNAHIKHIDNKHIKHINIFLRGLGVLVRLRI